MEYRIRTAVPADEARIRELFLEMLRTIYHTPRSPLSMPAYSLNALKSITLPNMAVGLILRKLNFQLLVVNALQITGSQI